MRSLSRRSPIVGRGYSLAVQACGPLACNMYTMICETTGDAVVIDPSIQNPFELDSLFKHFQRFNNNNSNNTKVQLKHILLTHGHADHVSGIVETLKKYPDAKLHLHPLDAENYGLAPEMALHFGLHMPLQVGTTKLPDPTDELYDGQLLKVGSSIELEVIHTPGHAPGHVAFVDSRNRSTCKVGEISSNSNDDDDHDKDSDGAVIISGDLLFQGSVGRTDFHNANMDDLSASIRRLYELYPDPSIVLSGHTTPTSLQRERNSNPFVSLALKRPIEWYNDAVQRHEWVK
jgi:hydroxyacylglutathione hydrolase